MTKFSNHKVRRGFTLIELLIVIGLLGALTALVLPSMMADREEALADICDYNQAGTLRVLKQYQQITGKLPDLMHTGLTLADEAMPGLPKPQLENIAGHAGSIHTLTAAEAAALRAVGITKVAKDEGMNEVVLAEGVKILEVSGWVDDSDPAQEYSFYGKTATEFNEEGAHLFAFYVAPTINWEAGSGDNKDWTKGNVTLSLDLAGQCPIPAGADFSYYLAYVAVWSDFFQVSGVSLARDKYFELNEAQDAAVAAVQAIDEDYELGGSGWTEANGVYTGVFSASGLDDITVTITDRTGTGEAKLVGTSCPECGILNP